MTKVRKIELLAPAKNLECGIEAIKHGADAIYIGAPKFSARASAGNSLNDITELVKFAHLFGARVYVALNTIMHDKELSEAEKLIWDLYKVNVDAIIIQDMGILKLDLPPIPFHASTQTDNRTPEKVKFLEDTGFSQIVLARELSLDEISTISAHVNTPLEVFVHGALCVSYSGQCYLSEAISRRSANRGNCAQLCRLPYSLVDAKGKTIMPEKHLLSMKDLNLSDRIEDLLDVGVSSLKIEGRLKDVTYVKNVVAYYRKKLDEIFTRRNEFLPASSGKCTYTFEPNLEKSFNRGFTSYFLNGRATNIWSVDSPKSIGEPIGKVKEVFDHFFTLSGKKRLNNGDGLCFVDNKDEMQGMRVNRVDGEKVFTFEKNLKLRKGLSLYRNFDHEFEKSLNKKTAERKIDAYISINDSENGYSITIEDEDAITATIAVICSKEPALKDQKENIKNILSKTGDTIFSITHVDFNSFHNWFIPVSAISEWRRTLIGKLYDERLKNHIIERKQINTTNHAFPIKNITYLGNVMNEKSKQFYVEHRSVVIQPAFEKDVQSNVPLMFTRHCIKHSLGWCPKETKLATPYQEPFYLKYNETKLRLEFDCRQCEMKVYKE